VLSSRREFGVKALSLAVAALVPTETSKEELLPREFRKFDYDNDCWIKINPESIQKGDVIWVFDPPDGSGVNEVYLVSRNCSEERQFYNIDQIDKKTNKWIGKVKDIPG